jgi:hypothetical protein
LATASRIEPRCASRIVSKLVVLNVV